MLIITTNESNPAALKLLLAGNLAKKDIQVKIVGSADKNLEPPKHLPYLETDQDSIIFVPNAALCLLLPPDEKNTSAVSKIGEWLEWEATVLAPSLTQLLGTSGKNDKAKNSVASSLKKLNNALTTGNLIEVGNELTACHVSIWSLLYPLYKDSALCKEYLEENLNITNWIKKFEDQVEFKDAISKLKIVPGVQSYQSLLTGARYLSGVPTASVGEVLNQSPQHQPDVITQEELEAAEKAWRITKVPKLDCVSKPVLPKANRKNILITSALPYVNNVPHLGNIIGCVLSSDVFARFCRICNHNTLFIGGTDEYGTATETKALEENLSCRAICDKYFAIHNDIYKWFSIGFDYFGRTSAPEQTELCQDMFLQLNNNGFMFTDTIEQLHCEKCDRFLADRFVEGGCPHIGCMYEDARGDQCDGCGKLVNAIELKNPRCKICGNTPKLRTSSQFFLDLPKLEPLLLHWMKQSSPGWSHNAEVIGRTWLKEGLKPRCITRDLKWGVPVPLKDYSNKVFYVWFDAPIGYMSISKAYTKEWEKWWRPPTDVDVTLYQFMAKDNVPFHSVMFPATLLGANRGYITVSHIMATEYLNYEDGKFSKSRGVGVFGNDARDTGIPSDVWRFYLLYVRPESQDSSFSWADLATKNNSELLNNLGNFINRALMFAKNNFDRIVPEMELIKEDYQLLVLCTRELKSYIACLEKAKLRDGIRHILSISRHGNQYMQSNQPWVLLKGSSDDKIRAGTVIALSCNIACLLGILLHPYMPETSDKLKKQLNAPDIALIPENPVIGQLLPSGHKLGEPSPLFAKLEPSAVEELKKKFAGKQGENGGKSPPKVVSTTVDLRTLESDVCKQADKVRALKSSGVDKKLWQPEVTILLNLKKKLEEAQKAPVNNVCQNGIDGPTIDVKTVEDLITQQGNLVRKLKEGGVEKSKWQPEVTKLLELKNKLATLTGGPVANQKGKNTKK